MMKYFAALCGTLLATSALGQTITPAPFTQLSVVCQGGAAQAITGTTSETNLVNCTIPAGILGANGAIRIDTTWSMTNNANAKNLRIRFSTTQADTSGGMLALNSSATSTGTAHFFNFLHNTGATNAQIVTATGNFGTGVTNTAGAIDTTATTYVNINAALASGTDTATLLAWTVEVIKP